MKTILCAVVLAVSMVVATAQPYRTAPGQPTKTELTKLKGVTDYIQDGLRANYTLNIPGAEQQYTLNETNNVVAFKSVGALTNVVVILPNPTNSARRTYELIAQGNVTIKLTNVFGVTYDTSTNVVTLSTFTSATNSAFRVYNNNRTNWMIVPF